jgi:4-carboxymuconolactone decarboxylase
MSPSSRFPPIDPSSLPPDQKAAYDEASEVTTKMFGDKFLYKDPSTSGFIGPFAPLLSTPSVMSTYLSLAQQLGQLHGLPPKAREVAILTTGSLFQAPYELYAHNAVAESTGLTLAQRQAVSSGKKPEGGDKLGEEEEVAFEFAITLGQGKGQLGDELWARGVELLGKEGCLALIHYVGFYAYTCIFLNGTGMPVPKH